MIPATVNIASYLPAMAAQQPDALAVAFPLGRRAGKQAYLRWTYKQLNDESDLIARGLLASGVTRGMRTVLMVKPSPEFFALVFAIFKIGAVLVGIDPGMGIRNLKTCLAEAEPEAFIGIRKAHIARWLFGWARKSNRINILVGRKFWPFGKTISLATVRARGAAGLPASHSAGQTQPHEETIPSQGTGAFPGVAATSRDEVAAILFTSGSTGVPKGVVYSHANFVAQVRALRDQYDIKPGEVDLCTFPLFALYAPALGMSAIVPEMDFTTPGIVDPRNIIEPVREFNVTNLFGSPALLRRLVEDPRARGLKPPSLETASKAQALPCLGSLKRVISAGAPVPSRTIARITKLLSPTAQVFTPYGATESLPVCSIGSDEILGETAALTDQGKGVCIGKPVSDIELKIIRISDDPIPHWSADLELPRGEIGEIVVRGPQVTRSYFNREQSTKLAKIHLNAGTFFHRMGDVGYLDGKGRVWFCGRKSERVNVQPPLFTGMVEPVFEATPVVWKYHKASEQAMKDLGMNPHFRTALVAVRLAGRISPVLCVEDPAPMLPVSGKRAFLDYLQTRLREQGAMHPGTASIDRFLMYAGKFPTDIRHNSKINRPLLAKWAAKQLGGQPA